MAAAIGDQPARSLSHVGLSLVVQRSAAGSLVGGAGWRDAIMTPGGLEVAIVQSMELSSQILELLRRRDPVVMRHYFAEVVRMVRRCVPEADAEAVARTAVDEVLGRIDRDDNRLSLAVGTRMAVAKAVQPVVAEAARRAVKEQSAITAKLLLRGDRETIRRFNDKLVCMARRYIPDKAAAESVARSAMAEILARLRSGEQPDDLDVWARTAVGRVARVSIRYYKVSSVRFRSGVHTDADDQAAASAIQHARDQLLCINEGVIESLPPTLQQAIVAIAVDGRTIKSVAAELGMPDSTLRNQLRRTRIQCQRELDAAQARERRATLGRQVRSTREQSSDQVAPRFPSIRRVRPSNESSSTR